MKRTWWILFLLFTVVPAVELYLLVQLGQVIGATATVAIIVLTGVIGAWLAKREGVAVIRKLSADLQKGLPPATRVVEGVLVLIGAVLLVTPGILTDITGFSLIIPLTRGLIAPVVLKLVLKRFGLEGMVPGQLPGMPEGQKIRVGAPARPPAQPEEETPFSHPTH